MNIRPTTLLVMVLSFVLSAGAPRRLSASDGATQPSGASSRAEFSAEDFDWREMVPHLFAAVDLPGEQGIKAMLENSKVLRVYVENEIRTECGREGNRCGAQGDASMLEGEVSKRIDAIVQERIFRQHKKAIVDYQFSRQPFPFSEIVAVKSDNQRDAYVIFQLAGRSYSAAQLQAQYGAPQDTDILQWYSVYKYQLNSTDCTSKAVFEIDPVDGAVLKVAVSVKVRKRH